jgi:hypothetical protein
VRYWRRWRRRWGVWSKRLIANFKLQICPTAPPYPSREAGYRRQGKIAMAIAMARKA